MSIVNLQALSGQEGHKRKKEQNQGLSADALSTTAYSSDGAGSIGPPPSTVSSSGGSRRAPLGSSLTVALSAEGPGHGSEQEEDLQSNANTVKTARKRAKQAEVTGAGRASSKWSPCEICGKGPSDFEDRL